MKVITCALAFIASVVVPVIATAAGGSYSCNINKNRTPVDSCLLAADATNVCTKNIGDGWIIRCFASAFTSDKLDMLSCEIYGNQTSALSELAVPKNSSAEDLHKLISSQTTAGEAFRTFNNAMVAQELGRRRLIFLVGHNRTADSVSVDCTKS